LIVITSYWIAIERAADIDPRFIISVMDPGSTYSIPSGPSLERHIHIAVHDIATDEIRYAVPYVTPNAEHVRQIVNFARAWDGRGRVLVHCVAGVSRSSAAGLILLATRHLGHEREIANLLRERGPWVNPNRLMVRLADDILDRNGLLVGSLEAMAEPSMQGVIEPVVLPSAW
jgi:predicted protein tyrosine phosphatase